MHISIRRVWLWIQKPNLHTSFLCSHGSYCTIANGYRCWRMHHKIRKLDFNRNLFSDGMNVIRGFGMIKCFEETVIQKGVCVIQVSTCFKQLVFPSLASAIKSKYLLHLLSLLHHLKAGKEKRLQVGNLHHWQYHREQRDKIRSW